MSPERPAIASESVERVSAKEFAFSAKVRRRVSLMLQNISTRGSLRMEEKRLALE